MSIEMTKEITLTLGESKNLRAEVTPGTVSAKNVSWDTTNSSVATVKGFVTAFGQPLGTVQAIKAGRATIKASVPKYISGVHLTVDEVTDTCEVVVLPNPPEPITAYPGECASACVAMSLKHLGVLTDLDQIKKTQGGIFVNWTIHISGTNIKYLDDADFGEALRNYQTHPDKYAPPIVKVIGEKGVTTNGDHWVIVTGIKSDGTFEVIDPNGINQSWRNPISTKQYYK